MKEFKYELGVFGDIYVLKAMRRSKRDARMVAVEEGER